MPTRVVDNGQGMLTIRNAQASDSGTYVCTGSNLYRIATDQAVLEINGTVRFIIDPQIWYRKTSFIIHIVLELDGTVRTHY